MSDRDKEPNHYAKWRRFIGFVATALTCVFGLGAVEELDVREASPEHESQLVDAGERVVDASPAEHDVHPASAAVAAAASFSLLLDCAPAPGPVRGPATTPAPFGPPVYRIAPSHSPPSA